MRIRRRLAVLAAGVVLAGASVVVGSTPTMPTIALPIDGASVVTEVTDIAIAIALLVWPLLIGFLFGRRLIGRIAGGARL